ARSADMQIAGRRGGEANTHVRAHLIVILSESEGSRKSSMTCELPRSARDDELAYTHFDRCCSRFAVRSAPSVFPSCKQRVSQRCGYSLFDKNFPGTAPRVSIFRKIHFCNSSVTIGERTNALDRVESNVRDVLRPQPFQERASLKRDWQRAKLYHGEICVCRIT